MNTSGENMRDLLTLVGRIFIFFVAFLVVLDSFGISVTPVLASLGVGSVAIALALQDTLSNFFSGVYTIIDKPIRAGDVARAMVIASQKETPGFHIYHHAEMMAL